MKKPFCTWVVLQRLVELPDGHAPNRFSLLFPCADGVAAFQALYVANGRCPSHLAIIQPGHGFRGNYTNFEDSNKIFARSVLESPAGIPGYLLYGGYVRGAYRRSCWPIYSEPICRLP